MEAEGITKEERRRLDRQRFIGWQTQRKLLHSRVLITPANGPNTELAKNLILSGVNVTLYDDNTTTWDDFQSNFLVAQSDVGRPRLNAVFEKLKEMNPTGKNSAVQEDLLMKAESLSKEQLQDYTMVATSTGDFDIMGQWSAACREAGVPYYNLVCCGLHAFVFISLGDSYSYREMNKTDNSVKKVWAVKSLQLDQCLDHSSAERNKEFIGAIAMMSEAEKAGIVLDPFAVDPQTLEAIVRLGVERVGEKHREFLTTFARTYGLDFCPTYSVIGSIISQEVIKVVENTSEPGMNWLVYNSEQGYANVVKLKAQKAQIAGTVPEA